MDDKLCLNIEILNDKWLKFKIKYLYTSGHVCPQCGHMWLQYGHSVVTCSCDNIFVVTERVVTESVVTESVVTESAVTESVVTESVVTESVVTLGISLKYYG